MWTNRFIVCFSQACAFVTSENVLKKSGIQLFRERLSEKVHVTVPKGIVGGFGCLVLQRNLKKWHWRPRTYVCECSRKVTKVCSTAAVVRNHVLIISHIFFGDCRVHIFSDNLSRNSCMHIKKTVGNRKNVIMKKCDFMRALHSLVSLTVGDYIMCHLLTNLAGR